MYRNIIAEMVRNGMTRAFVAKKLKISVATLRKKIAGESDFKNSEVEILLSLFGNNATFEYLFEVKPAWKRSWKSLFRLTEHQWRKKKRKFALRNSLYFCTSGNIVKQYDGKKERLNKVDKKTKQLLQITKNAYSQALEVLGFVKQKEQMSDQKLNTELERRIRQIREVNSQKIIMNVYVPQIIKETLEKDNYLISQAQALPIVVAKFNQELQAGRIDSLFNFVVPEDESVKGE